MPVDAEKRPTVVILGSVVTTSVKLLPSTVILDIGPSESMRREGSRTAEKAVTYDGSGNIVWFAGTQKSDPTKKCAHEQKIACGPEGAGCRPKTDAFSKGST